ncbi:MAG TPA: 30S ribosomal protein S6 [Pontiellaceae bacterium]|nr:30S ribosomal protein S6 [Pontiellaceae bacterium]HPR82389.1 30S ribosomal protein S6 [Pontiellaceae bacterium]
MKTLYEGLFIFPETLEEAQLDLSIEAVKTELEKLGGTLESSTRLGKRSFARPLRKKKAGFYVVIMFRLEGEQINAFKHRLKLATDVFRAQFMQKDGVVAAQEA